MGIFKDLFNRTPKPGKPVAVTDETFEPEVLAGVLPAVVDFWSRTCPPCHVMAGLLNEIGPDYIDRVRMFKVDVETNPETARLYQIQSVPTLVFIRNGRVVDRVVGLMPLNPLRQKLDLLASKGRSSE